MTREFQGKIELDIRDSTPDWDAFLDTKAPAGAPNVLVILYDDTGQAAWSPYGGRITMPTMEPLAENGVTYSQWHTTALCAPTRSTFLTGRNHHQNGFGTIAESAVGFPGYNGHIPPDVATMATVLRDAGWSTFWVGKNHNVPVDAFDMGSSKKKWPLGLGYDRFYGFIGGETNSWYPELIEDNHYVDQPYSPEEGYHFSKDIADKAIQYLQDAKQSRPDKPWYMWLCPAANHAPHHAPQEYIAKYKGQFDDGYEAYREWVLPRMIERGILPEGTQLTPINPMPEGTHDPGDDVRPWDSLSDDEKKLFSHMAEVYAGMSEYTDAQMGRVIAYLEESGQLDNTLIVYAADNGASGEGSPNGSVNENKFFNGYPDDIQENLSMIDKLGSPDTYNHYPTGWAVAFSTPYRMFKRYSYAGGACDPLVISWPKGMKARGELRGQHHHCTDIVPTIPDCRGVEFPEAVDGVKQQPLVGASMRYSFEDDDSRWELYDLSQDWSEADDLAGKHPEKLKELQDAFLIEATKYNVLPLDDRFAERADSTLRPSFFTGRDQVTLYPGMVRLPEGSAPKFSNVAHTISVHAEIPKDGAEGVLLALGGDTAGFVLMIRDGKLVYHYNWFNTERYEASSDQPVPTGEVELVMDFAPEGERRGPAAVTLRVNGKKAGEGRVEKQVDARFSTESLDVGMDTLSPVAPNYPIPHFPFTGTIERIDIQFPNGGGEHSVEDKRRATLALD